MIKENLSMNKNRRLFTIQNREILKILADPLRNQIIEAMIDEQHTVKQVADKLGLAPSKLYYHFNLLEQNGLIEVVETRMVANMVEKHFRTTFDELEVDPNLMSTATDEGKETVNAMIASTIDTTRDDILRSLQARYFQLEHGAPADPRRLILNRLTGNIPNSRIEEFIDQIQQLFKDFIEADAGSGSPESKLYAITVAFYPSFYFTEESSHEESQDA
jgi:DNA-binding transcriptional ArsR family regulator